MKNTVPFALAPALAFAWLLPPASATADWPQWRGPDRNGAAASGVSLPGELDEDESLEKVWESLEIPSDHYGGHGSVVVAGGKVFLSVVWHRDEPTETRRIDRDVLGSLGYRGTGSIPDEIVEKMEHERMNLSRRLRGAALDEWAENWVKEHLDDRTQLSLGSWVISRFRQGAAAIPLSVYDVLLEVANTEFAGQAEVEEWVESQGFEPSVAERIIAAVPSTTKMANDVVLCLDGESGEVVWRFETEGYPSGRSSSSTPAVADGRVYAALSEHFYCVDAETGEEIWRAPLAGRKGPASSPLVHHGTVYIQQNRLTAFDAATGEERWENTEVRGSNASPVAAGDIILCNEQRGLVGVDAYSGVTLWTHPGGGDGTPVVSDGYVVVSSRGEDENIIAYRLTDEGLEHLWTVGFMARRYSASPLIHEGHVYYLGSERHVCIDLETGEKKWDRQAQSSISSPLVADGKLLVYENRGGLVGMIDTYPGEYRHLGRAKVGALYCASPALVGRDLYLRSAKSVIRYRFVD